MTYRELIQQLLLIEDLDKTTLIHIIYRDNYGMVSIYETGEIDCVSVYGGVNHGIRVEKDKTHIHNPYITALNHRDDLIDEDKRTKL